MCLYPKIIRNPRYRISNNNYICDRVAKDERLEYIELPCGFCIECRRKKAREWNIRLKEELQYCKAQMVTLTFSEENLNDLVEEFGEECNGVAYRALRRFCERYRKIYKVGLRHFVVTELGHTGTERIHMHGILFYDKNSDIKPLTKEELSKLWKYGFVHIGDYCNEKSINYIIKYILKQDSDHPGYQQKIYSSKNIGYRENSEISRRCKWRGKETIDTIIDKKSGRKIILPMYYKRKLWTDEQREDYRLWKLDENVIYLGGNIYNKDEISQEEIKNITLNLRSVSDALGYIQYEKKPYNVRNIHTKEEREKLDQLNEKIRKKNHELFVKNYQNYVKNSIEKYLANKKLEITNCKLTC